MVSNNSTNGNYLLMWINISYGVQGAIIGGSNLFIVFVVLYFKALRNAKEYLVIMSLSLADALNMLGGVVGGTRRAYLIAIGQFSSLMTLWDCTTTLQNLIWSFSEILSGLILLTISIDRLLCVAFPLPYIKWSTKYVMMLFGSTYLYAIMTGTIMSLVFVYETNHLNISVSPMCYVSSFGDQGINIYYATYRIYAAVVFAAASIIVYGFIWVLYKKQLNRIAANQTTDANKRRSLGRQRRLTQNLGISCLCTLFVFIIPYGMGYFLYGVIPISLVYMLFFISNFNPLCNVYIYYSRQPEMKQAFKALFSGKLMPDSLNQWKANTMAQKNKVVKQVERPSVDEVEVVQIM